MAAKNIPDFDWAQIESEDLFEFFDTSEGANKKGSFSDLVGVLAGDGLQNRGNKLSIGGFVDSNTYLSTEMGGNSRIAYFGGEELFNVYWGIDADFIGEAYLSTRESQGRASMSLYGEYLDLLCANESRQSYLAMRSGLMEFYHEEPNGYSGITLGLGYVDLYSENYTDSSLGMVRSSRPIFYTSSFDDVLDSDDAALVNAGYLRSNFLPKEGATYTAGENLNLNFELETALSIGVGNDGAFVIGSSESFSQAYLAAAGHSMTMEQFRVFFNIAPGGRLQFANIDIAGSAVSALGTNAAPSVNLGTAEYWLGRPNKWLKVDIGSSNYAIPCYQIS